MGLQANLMTHAQAAALAREDMATSRLINNALYVCERKLGCREYGNLIRLRIANAFDMGNRNHGRKAYKEMILKEMWAQRAKIG